MWMMIDVDTVELKDVGPAPDARRNEDLPFDGFSGDSLFVGVVPVDPDLDATSVGSLGLGRAAQSDGAVKNPGSRAAPPPPGSSVGAVLGKDAAESMASGGNAISATPVIEYATSNIFVGIDETGDPGSPTGSAGATTEIVTFAGSGITFNNTFEKGVTAAFKANILTAEQDIATLWTDTITLTFDFVEKAEGKNGNLAGNSFSILGFDYATLKGALQAKSGDSSIALAAYNSLPATDPAGGQIYWLPGGYANFLGLSSSSFTDTVTLNSSYGWSFGQDVVNTMIHEITEGGMGRVGGLGVGLGGRWSTMDLFSYDTSGVRDLSSTDASRVFSYDGGKTTSQGAGLFYFAANSGGDAADFQQFDVFGTGNPGETNTISQTDINEMEALGWTPACYCRGTLILTDQGEVPVEALSIGARLVTRDGTAKPVKWIGRRSYVGWLAAGNPRVLPVCFKPGSLADGMPRRELWVSPEHAMYLDGVLVPAELLVNGSSILKAPSVDEVEYFHLELEEHDVILAEGAWAESFIDDDSRGMFHNAGEYRALHSAAAPGGEAQYCAPRLEEGFELEALRRRLLGRTHRLQPDGTASPSSALEGHLELVRHDRIAGWARDPEMPTARVALVVLANGAEIGRVMADRYRRDLAAAGIGDGCHGFELAVPGGLEAAWPHTIEVYRADQWTMLPGSPIVLQPAADRIGGRLL